MKMYYRNFGAPSPKKFGVKKLQNLGTNSTRQQKFAKRKEKSVENYQYVSTYLVNLVNFGPQMTKIRGDNKCQNRDPNILKTVTDRASAN